MRARAAGPRWAPWSGWTLWEMSPWVSGFVVAVVAAYAVVIAIAAVFGPFHLSHAALFAVFVALSLLSIELTRNTGEPAGTVKYVYGVWQLPIAILLPPIYALVAPIANLAFIQWRVRKTLIHRRVFTSAALGLSYGAASLAYHLLAARLPWLSPGPGAHWLSWVLVVAACGALQWAINSGVVMTAVKGSDRSASVRKLMFSREPMFNDAAELNTGVVLAVITSAAWFLAVLALPFVVLLHRSSRHAELVNDSRVDGKTGLLNAVAWQREARLEITRAIRTHTPVAVAIADLDHFKAINDTYGHLAGDAVLATVARTMLALLRDYDITGRFGGEEFAILLPQTGAEEATRVAERLRERLSEIIIPVPNDPTAQSPLRVTVSIGIATLEGSRRDLDEMLAAADAALYEAKNSGRNRVCALADNPAGA